MNPANIIPSTTGSFRQFHTIIFLLAAAIVLLTLKMPAVMAQNPQVQKSLAEIKEAAAMNKQALSHYTWQEQQTISIGGEAKKQQLFQVRLGPDGKPQKTPLGDQPAAPPPSGGALKQRIIQKKTEEFKDYGKEMADLAQSYAQLDPQLLQQAYQQGNVSLGPAGAPGQVQLMIKNYLKPNDQVALVFNTASKAITGLNISSYMDDPSDAMTMSVQFAQLPDGTNHVSNMTVNGTKKQLMVAAQNSNYKKM